MGSSWIRLPLQKTVDFVSMNMPLHPDRDNAELWEARYRAGDTGWDRGASHPSLPGVLTRRWLSGDILVPGCGRGHDVKTIAAFDEQYQVTGIDIAPSALNHAVKYRSYSNEFYYGFSLFRMAEDTDDRFDAVWEHTCFCAIHPDQRSKYAHSIAQLLKEGGHLTGVFYLATKDPGDGPPFKIPLGDLQRCLESTFHILEVLPVDQTYPGREEEEVLIHAKKK